MTASSAGDGQTTAELAVVFPVVLLLALALTQAALVLRDDLALVNAAREAARAAVSIPTRPGPSGPPPPCSPAPRSSRAPAGRWGSCVSVRVTYRSATDLPLVGPLLPDPVLVARAAMRVER